MAGGPAIIGDTQNSSTFSHYGDADTPSAVFQEQFGAAGLVRRTAIEAVRHVLVSILGAGYAD